MRRGLAIDETEGNGAEKEGESVDLGVGRSGEREGGGVGETGGEWRRRRRKKEEERRRKWRRRRRNKQEKGGRNGRRMDEEEADANSVEWGEGGGIKGKKRAWNGGIIERGID